MFQLQQHGASDTAEGRGVGADGEEGQVYPCCSALNPSRFEITVHSTQSETFSSYEVNAIMSAT